MSVSGGGAWARAALLLTVAAVRVGAVVSPPTDSCIRVEDGAQGQPRVHCYATTAAEMCAKPSAAVAITAAEAEQLFGSQQVSGFPASSEVTLVTGACTKCTADASPAHEVAGGVLVCAQDASLFDSFRSVSVCPSEIDNFLPYTDVVSRPGSRWETCAAKCSAKKRCQFAYHKAASGTCFLYLLKDLSALDLAPDGVDLPESVEDLFSGVPVAPQYGYYACKPSHDMSHGGVFTVREFHLLVTEVGPTIPVGTLGYQLRAELANDAHHHFTTTTAAAPASLFGSTRTEECPGRVNANYRHCGYTVPPCGGSQGCELHTCQRALYTKQASCGFFNRRARYEWDTHLDDVNPDQAAFWKDVFLPLIQETLEDFTSQRYTAAHLECQGECMVRDESMQRFKSMPQNIVFKFVRFTDTSVANIARFEYEFSDPTDVYGFNSVTSTACNDVDTFLTVASAVSSLIPVVGSVLGVAQIGVAAACFLASTKTARAAPPTTPTEPDCQYCDGLLAQPIAVQDVQNITCNVPCWGLPDPWTVYMQNLAPLLDTETCEFPRAVLDALTEGEHGPAAELVADCRAAASALDSPADTSTSD